MKNKITITMYQGYIHIYIERERERVGKIRKLPNHLYACATIFNWMNYHYNNQIYFNIIGFFSNDVTGQSPEKFPLLPWKINQPFRSYKSEDANHLLYGYLGKHLQPPYCFYRNQWQIFSAHFKDSIFRWSERQK